MSLGANDDAPDTIGTLLLLDDSQDSSYVPPSPSDGSVAEGADSIQPGQSVSRSPANSYTVEEPCDGLVARFSRYLRRRYSKATCDKYTACLEAVLDPEYTSSDDESE